MKIHTGNKIEREQNMKTEIKIMLAALVFGTATLLANAQDNNGGPGGTPTNSTRADLWPFMADHKTFSAINVINGDSITFTYTLTIQSGG